MHDDPTPADLDLVAKGAVGFAGAKAEFGLSRSYLYEEIGRGRIRIIRRGRRVLLPRVELERLLAEHLEPPRDESAS